MDIKMPIVWNNTFEVGINEMDEQHRILVATLNEANERLNEDASISVLHNITKDLLSYALYHFETEEELMQKYDYRSKRPEEFEEHMRQHREFSAQMVHVHESIKSGHPIDKETLIGFLVNWLINHINKTDKKLGKFLNEVAA